uniref:Uncharacterized protein n=1 Tax=Triticum urartu TaxID=4572 RepID=A0A8R7P3L1_TRIUA
MTVAANAGAAPHSRPSRRSTGTAEGCPAPEQWPWRQDVLLLDAAVPNELSLPEEVEQHVQHPLGLLSCSTWTSSLTAAFCPPSVILVMGTFSTRKTCVLTTLAWMGGFAAWMTPSWCVAA